MDYRAAQKRFVRFKSALTRALNGGNSRKILHECDAFFEHYERADTEPFPDAWHRWQIARDDARLAIARENSDWLRG